MREIGDILLSYDAEFVAISSAFLQLRPSISIHSPRFLIINNAIKENPDAFSGDGGREPRANLFNGVSRWDFKTGASAHRLWPRGAIARCFWHHGIQAGIHQTDFAFCTHSSGCSTSDQTRWMNFELCWLQPTVLMSLQSFSSTCLHRTIPHSYLCP